MESLITGDRVKIKHLGNNPQNLYEICAYYKFDDEDGFLSKTTTKYGDYITANRVERNKIIGFEAGSIKLSSKETRYFCYTQERHPDLYMQLDQTLQKSGLNVKISQTYPPERKRV